MNRINTLATALEELTRACAEGDMTASGAFFLQERACVMEPAGYAATRHQPEVGAGYFDQVTTTISGGAASTLALSGSTEEAQFDH